MTRRSHGPWLDNLEPTREPPMTLHDEPTIDDYAAALTVVHAAAPGAPLSSLRVTIGADSNPLVSPSLGSVDEFDLWVAALGVVPERRPCAEGDRSLHTAAAYLDGDVVVHLLYVDRPGAVAA